MRVSEAGIPGLLLVEDTPIKDSRGHFIELFTDGAAFRNKISADVRMVNVSMSILPGTVRGLHWQAAPHGQTKLVRCYSGSIYDVAVDVRPLSATYGKHYGIKMFSGDGKMLYIPTGFAHGWQALERESELMYVVGECGWAPDSEKGLRPMDPRLAINWPLPPVALSARDMSWPLLPDLTMGAAR